MHNVRPTKDPVGVTPRGYPVGCKAEWCAGLPRVSVRGVYHSTNLVKVIKRHVRVSPRKVNSGARVWGGLITQLRRYSVRLTVVVLGWEIPCGSQ